jgi:parallel beta-helix repeat protein
MKRSVAVLLLAAVAALGLSLAPAGAAGALVVDDDDGRCRYGHAGYSTIQSAVDDAEPGDVILVCPGVYEETVTVTTPHLRIKGAKAGRDARRRSQHGESEVVGTGAGAAVGAVQLHAKGITWDGFLIRENFAGPGMHTSPSASKYDVRNTIFKDNGIGIHLGSNGARRSEVRHNLFIANNEFTGIGGGNGIYSSEGAQRVLIADNRFEDHNGAGILFADHLDGVPQRDVRVERNQSVRDMTFAAFYASSQVCLVGNLVDARVGDPDFPGPASAIFIGARNDGVVVERNKIRSASGNGIDVTNSGEPGKPVGPADVPKHVQVLRNKVSGVRLDGIAVSASGVGQYELRGNHALHNAKVGIHLGEKTDNALLANNTARGNGVLDCQDESPPGEGTVGDGTAGTDNTWRNNVGPNDDPDGICHQHHKKKKHHHKRKHHKKKRHRPDPCGCPASSWRLGV